MPTRATTVNPDLLKWARNSLGLSIIEVAQRIHKSPAVVEDWESGQSHPTFNQLELLADSVYRRPVAVFFFPAPPEEPSVAHDFRTLPGTEIDKLDRDTRLALRDARAYQVSLSELSRGLNQAGDRLLTSSLQVDIRTNVSVLARLVREKLGFTVTQQSSWRSSTQAFKNWRIALEQVGIYVFKRSIEQREISGFCLNNPVFPIIIINNSTPHTRQIFTLFHELAHLLFGVSSITTDLGLANRLSGDAHTIEKKCNKFAAEFLVPTESFPWSLVDVEDVEGTARRLAQRYSVSREVILRKLLDQGHVSNELYLEKATEWAREAEEARTRRGPGGNYYATQATYLGESFLNLGFSQYRSGIVSKAELADHFGMRAKTVGGLEDYILSRGQPR